MTEIQGEIARGFEPVRDAFAENFAREQEIGAAVTVYQHGRPVVDLWAGQADADTGRAWTSDTLQFVFSATKGVTAICALVLAQRGALDLDAPVADYWPEFAAEGKGRIPVRWLLTHQAGLPVLDERVPLAEALRWDPVVEALAAQRPVWEPGTAHGYHALTYGWLVGEVVRRITGRSLGSFLREEIAAPLDLDFWIGLPAAEHHRVSRAISWEMEDLKASVDAPEVMFDPTSLAMRTHHVTEPQFDHRDPRVWAAEMPSVNGLGTAHSLARLYAALVSEVDGVRVLDERTVAEASTVHTSGVERIHGFDIRYGLGFLLPPENGQPSPLVGPRSFGHPGYGGSLGFADPEHGLGFGFVANHLGAPQLVDPRSLRLARAVYACLS
ncbi:serine hydrolase domain-containing protein [Streptoalloteichus hindustanus]|uniref:CubicO group peptidase, beta-lactamase class C family n=1 Tax=Streptoalloteichus hindustanus TaxID=2017 RepID=A0A1M5D831_STRHI|nr:serine hydrolase domain-containing protein [Streptoalloteichus hindustanus]SHF63047.1 CubicO group peptidase, beta-lactamase class C family [Streptoalloteichus hindustanus]